MAAKELDKDNAKKNSGIFQTRNVHEYVICNDCGKRRCIFSISSGFGSNYFSQMRALDDVIADGAYEYMCSDALLGMDKNPISCPASTDMFHVTMPSPEACQLRTCTLD